MGSAILGCSCAENNAHRVCNPDCRFSSWPTLESTLRRCPPTRWRHRRTEWTTAWKTVLHTVRRGSESPPSNDNEPGIVWQQSLARGAGVYAREQGSYQAKTIQAKAEP